MSQDRYDSWLESPYHTSDEEDYPDYFPARVAELLDTKYSISKNYGNFSEGISEAKKEDQEIIKEMLLHNPIDFEKLGRKLWAMSFEYMEGYAESEANEDFENRSRD